GEGANFINTTIADNDGPALAGVTSSAILPLVGGPTSPQPIRLHNTIVSGGTAAPCGPPDAAAPIVNLGNNLQYPSTVCAPGIAVGAPNFGPSYIPLPTSPAANAGNDSVCAASPVAGRDIFDTTRPDGNAHCTIGAAEATLENIVDRTLGPVTDAI